MDAIHAARPAPDPFAHLTAAERNGLSFYDSIVRGLYAGRASEDEERFRPKIRRKKSDAGKPDSWALVSE